MSSSRGGGKVPVFYFPKRSKPPVAAAPSVRTVTLTLPEVPAVTAEPAPQVSPPRAEPERPAQSEELVTEPDLRLETSADAASRKGTLKPSRSSKRGGRRTASSEEVTDKATDPRTPVKSTARRPTTPSQQRELAMKGHRLFERGRLQDARKVLESVVAEQPNDSFPHTMLGTVYLALGAPDRALALFEAALALDPDDLAARVYRGEIQLNRGRRKAGLRDLQYAVRLSSKEDPFVQRARRLIRRAEDGKEGRER